ncbi:MAG: response regulator transcription factor [Acidobacteriia bacterium]|nr:response regulator transcription factor [Terriglobia bacterium]
MTKTRILIADDHQVVRKGVAAILGERPEWEICAEASTGREAIAAAARLKPDVVVMDICMPDMNGLEATRHIVKQNPQTQVLILSMHQSEQLVRDVLASGARGYLLKGDVSGDLVAAVDALGRQKPFFTSSVVEAILSGYQAGGSSSQLTLREREILQLVAEGKANKEIAAALNITVKTVETHRARIMAKLDLHSVPDLVRYALRNHIIDC